MTLRNLAEKYLKQLGGKPRAKAFYRCGYCRHRKALAKELWLYLRPPKCICGRVDWRMDMGRYNDWLNKRHAYALCRCSAAPFPHKPTISVWCVKHPTGPSEDDWQAGGYF